jgi:hypothetical protein
LHFICFCEFYPIFAVNIAVNWLLQTKQKKITGSTYADGIALGIDLPL